MEDHALTLGGAKPCQRVRSVGIPRHPWGKPPHSGSRAARAGILALSVLCFLCVSSVGSPRAEAAPDGRLRDPDYLASAGVGFEQIFELNYDAAMETFSALEAHYPAHPGPPLGAAAVVWLRELLERQDFDLNRFIALGYFDKKSEHTMPASMRELFFERVEQSRRLSQAVLEQDPGNEDARFFLGSAEGLSAAFSYTVDGKTMDAFAHAKRAYRYHRELLDSAPGYSDAYVSVGVYEYIVDNLRWYLKWPAKVIGYRGSEEQGIDYLESARRGESTLSNEASAMLMVIYFRERKFHHSLAIARGLRQHFPQNLLFHLNDAQILDRMGKKQDAATRYLEVARLAEEKRPNYQLLPLESFRYSLGRRLRQLGRSDVALRTFNDCLDDLETPDEERALCHVEAGLLEDQRGQRERAVGHYQAALALPRVEDSHKIAERQLRSAQGAR